LAVFAALAIPFGVASGVLHPTWPSDPGRLVLFALVAVVVPSLGEEILFRASLVPHRTEGGPWWGWVFASLVLFALWHPLNAALFLPRAWPLFSDPRFVVLTLLLGVALSVLYRRTGSLWPGVAFHWAVVVGWKACLGGPLVLFGGSG
jgi:predicted Abi (CAAX) family protease